MCLFDLQGSSSPSRRLPWKMGHMHCLKISVTNYRPTQRTIPHEQNVSIKVLQLWDLGKKQVLTWIINSSVKCCCITGCFVPDILRQHSGLEFMGTKYLVMHCHIAAEHTLLPCCSESIRTCHFLSVVACHILPPVRKSYWNYLNHWHLYCLGCMSACHHCCLYLVPKQQSVKFLEHSQCSTL